MPEVTNNAWQNAKTGVTITIHNTAKRRRCIIMLQNNNIDSQTDFVYLNTKSRGKVIDFSNFLQN